MICEMDIPWTPRTRKKFVTPKDQDSPSLEVLRAIIMKTLAPFTEARVALAAALMEYSRSIGEQPGNPYMSA